MTKKHRIIPGLLAIVCLIFINGCWDVKEFEHLALIKGIGISIAGEEDRIKYTVQFIRETGDEDGQEESRVTSSTGYTLYEAHRNLLKQLGLRPFYGHNEVVIIDQELASRGVNTYLDYFIRNKEIRGHTVVAITPDDPEKILSTSHYMHDISAIDIDNILDGFSAAGTIISSKLLPLKKDLINRHIDPVAGKIELRPGGPEENNSKKNLLFSSGGTILRGDIFVDWLNRRETRGYNWVHIPGEIRGPVIIKSDEQKYNNRISIQVYRGKSRLVPHLDGDGFKVDIEIKTEGFIIENMDPEFELIDEANLKQMNRRFAQVIENEILSALAAGRANNADILGLADAIYKKFPRELEKVESSWKEIYQEIPVNISVTADIRRTGMLK